jgi:hypothetical protein
MVRMEDPVPPVLGGNPLTDRLTLPPKPLSEARVMLYWTLPGRPTVLLGGVTLMVKLGVPEGVGVAVAVRVGVLVEVAIAVGAGVPVGRSSQARKNRASILVPTPPVPLQASWLRRIESRCTSAVALVLPRATLG